MSILGKCLENISASYIISAKMNITPHFGSQIIKLHFIKVIVTCYVIIVPLVCSSADYEVHILGKEDTKIMQELNN